MSELMSDQVKKFQPKAAKYGVEMAEHEKGDYVDFIDYAKLREENAVLRQERDEWMATCARLQASGGALRTPWDLSKILGAETRRLVEWWDSVVADSPKTSLAKHKASLFENATIPMHAKAGCIGEFQFVIEHGLCCPQCWHKNDADCELCNGASEEGGYSDLLVDVPWDPCKEIWKAMNKIKAYEIRNGVKDGE